MIVVTGAAGFIASCLVTRLNEANFNDIVVVDNFSIAKKENNLKGKKIREYVDRMEFFQWLEKNYEEVEFIFHLGARTDTTEIERGYTGQRGQDEQNRRARKAAVQSPGKALTARELNIATGALQ